MSSIRLISFTFSLFIFSFSMGQHACVDILKNRPGGASVEMEMPTDDAVMSILTTTTGNLRPLKLIFYPSSFRSWVPRNISYFQYHAIPWESIPAQVQRDLVIAAIKNYKLSFFKSREIPFLKVKENINLTFEKKTNFMGIEYTPGSYIIPIGKYFVNTVEFKGPENVKDFSGVELHLRSPYISAGDLVKSAWVFQENIGTKRTHFHEHIVASLPKKSLRENPIQTAAILTEFYRRVNLIAEVRGLLRGARVETIRNPVIGTDFDSLASRDLVGVFRYFAEGAITKIGDSLKMAWVGFRGSDKYDQPGLYGFEFRALLSDDRPEIVSQILTRIQEGMRTENYGFNQSQFIRYLGSKNISIEYQSSVAEGFRNSLYRREDLVDSNPILKPFIEELWASPKDGEIRKALAGNDGLRMLFHDWANDAIYFEDSVGQAKVIEAQKLAFQELMKKPSDDLNILARFFHRSGLLEKLETGFGIKLQ